MLECFKSSSPGLFSVLYILIYSWFMQSLVYGSVPPQVQDFKLPFVELHGIPAKPISTACRDPSAWQHEPLLLSATLPSFVFPVNLLRVHSVHHPDH